MPAEESHLLLQAQNPPPATKEGFILTAKRAVIFANGTLDSSRPVRTLIEPDDILIAADGGAAHLQKLGLKPDIVIGDFDSISQSDLEAHRASGSDIYRHPANKDYTDLELAVSFAQSSGADEILILAALGARWDQTLANLLLPAASTFREINIRLVDGNQEVILIRPGDAFEIEGSPGDTVSLIPIGGDARGIVTTGLEYALNKETLYFGTTRGISNVLIDKTASVKFDEGLILCVKAHNFV